MSFFFCVSVTLSRSQLFMTLSSLVFHEGNFHDTVSNDDIRTIISTYGCNIRTLLRVLGPSEMDAAVQLGVAVHRLSRIVEDDINMTIAALPLTKVQTLISSRDNAKKHSIRLS